MPWPTGADGTSLSLQRSSGTNYANDPANWFVAAPSAGRTNSVNSADSNGDGLPDAWQIQYFGSITAPQAAPGADPDGDGFTNEQEYLAGTDPTLAGDYLKIESVQISGAARTINFNAVAGKTYTIVFKNRLDDVVWQRMADVPAQGVTAPIGIPDSSAGAPARFYRLITPQLP